MATMDELLDLEHAGWQSLCQGTGGRFYGEVMTDDGLMILADGSVFERTAVERSLDEAPPWFRYDIDDPQLVPLGDAGAALVYTGRAWKDDAPEPTFSGRMTSVYVVSGDGWRLALYQQTHCA